MTRIFRYILKSDTGMAPCIDHGLVSLATCKPKIRESASPGDWVMGFYPGSELKGVVAWAAQISGCYAIGAYETEFRGRSDAVYRERRDGTFKRLRPDYHPGEKEIRKDLSAPALVFEPGATWYFGDHPVSLPNKLMHLAAGGQGHRVNLRTDGDLEALQNWLQDIGQPGIYGKPRHTPPPTQQPREC